MNLKEYWAAVNETAAKLPPGDSLYVTSIDNRRFAGGVRGGVMCEVLRKKAAELIVQGTHRISTAEELAAYQAESKTRAEEIADKEYQRKQNFALPREVADLVAAAVQGVTKPSGRARKPEE